MLEYKNNKIGKLFKWAEASLGEDDISYLKEFYSANSDSIDMVKEIRIEIAEHKKKMYILKQLMNASL